MDRFESFLMGEWRAGEGEPTILVNPATEEPIGEIRPAAGLGDAIVWGRAKGGAGLRALSFAQRGQILADLAKVIHAHREELITLAVTSGGNTRGDAKFDIDGATAVLAGYAALAPELGTQPWIPDGEAVPLFRNAKIRAQQLLVPRHGLAVHINAFNFPAWGMVGKLAVAVLAGVPVLSKPATSTAALAARIARIVLDAGLLPEGAFQLLLGPAGDLLDHVGPQDVVAFTGSADTGAKIRGHRRVIAANVRVNLEADSLNAAIVGPDVQAGTELFDLVVKDAATEITQKAGQKCTATRRILVPAGLLDEVREALAQRLGDVAARTGDPADDAVRMGPLATRGQLDDGRRGVTQLETSAKRIVGDPQRRAFVGVPDGKGFFLEPILLHATAAAALDPSASFHRLEVFGPVATLLPYDGKAETAARIVALGEGSLVSTLYADDREFLSRTIAEVSPWLGRVVVASEKIAGASLPPGGVFPVVNHGGPGRAGDGEELGGRSGMRLYLQRTSVQGGAADLPRLLGGSAPG